MSDLDEWDIRRKCPDDLRRGIATPHEHETPHNKPLWIIWRMTIARDGVPDGPHIDSVCDEEQLAIAHVGMVFESYHPSYGDTKVFVERIPANHRFASSMAEHFTDSRLAKVKELPMRSYRRVGD